MEEDSATEHKVHGEETEPRRQERQNKKILQMAAKFLDTPANPVIKLTACIRRPIFSVKGGIHANPIHHAILMQHILARLLAGEQGLIQAF